jgi:predicted metal-dependent peptidase
MEKARAAMVLRDPFFATLALRLKLIEDKRVATACTDGIKLIYSNTYIEEIKNEYGAELLPEYAKGLWAHEVLHNAFAHHTRRQNREPRLWNLACDYAVDEVLVTGGYKVPHALVEPDYKGMSAEEIYTLLQQKYSKRKKCPKCGGKGSDKNGDKKSGQGSSGDQDDEQSDGQNGGQGGCDVCQGEGQGIPQGAGDVSDYPGTKPGQKPTETDMAQQEQEWKVATKQAAQTAKVQGKLPGHFEKMVGELTDPKIPWREALARWLTEVSKNDYTWTQPNRRHMVRGIYLPSLQSEHIGLVVIYMDSSGSVGEKEQTMLGSEVQGILAEYGQIELVIVYVDTQVAGFQEVSVEDIPLKLEVKGGGGTDFRPGFVWVEEQDYVPVGAIYMTDGYCSSFPDEEPDYPVIWCLTEEPGNWNPPFGETIKIRD